MRRFSLVLVALGAAGCVYGATPPAPPPQPPAPVAAEPELEAPTSDSLPADVRGVRVYTVKSLGRPCEVVGVLDFHSRADSEDKGFDQLRSKAKSIGADTVLGGEFEHGHDGELSHLSGMAARCSAAAPRNEPGQGDEEESSWR